MKRILITGTNQGIGLQLAKQYVARGDEVIATARKTSAELSSIGCEVMTDVDVTDGASIEALKEKVGDREIDVLINNAGILTKESFGDFDWERMIKQYQVNALGPLRITAALAGNLGPGAKVGIVTSRVGSLADNDSGGIYGYRMSKAAANMAGVNLAHDMKARGVAVALLHPGYVRTNMTGGKGLTDTTTSARGLIQRMDELSMETTGTFWHAEGHQLPW